MGKRRNADDTFMVFLSAEEKVQLRVISLINKRTMSDMIRSLINSEFEKQSKTFTGNLQHPIEQMVQKEISRIKEKL